MADRSQLIADKKLPQTDKPDSVLLPESNSLYHLSSPVLASGIHLPTLPNFFAKTKRAALLGLRPIEVYLTFQPTRFIHTGYCYLAACALTTRFHLFRLRGSFFSVTLSVHCFELALKAAAHPLDGVVLYVVRTFLTLICTSPR